MEDLIIEYIELTKLAIDELEGENFDNLEDILDKREEILNKIKKINNDKLGIKELIEKHKLIEIEKVLLDKLNKRKIDVRENLNKLRKTKVMNNQYRSAIGSISFLNKRI